MMNMVNRSNTLNSSRGFTMVELLVVIPLFVICGAFLCYLFLFQYWMFNNQNAELAITQSARQSLDTINGYVRQSYRVASSYSGYVTDAQTLVLQLQSIDSSNQVIAGTYDYVVSYLSGTDLYVRVFPDAGSSRLASTKKVADNIDVANFGFTYDNANYTLTTQITTTIALVAPAYSQFGAQTRSLTVSSAAKLRNY